MVNFYYGKHRQNAQTKDKRPVSLGKSEAEHKIRKKLRLSIQASTVKWLK